MKGLCQKEKKEEKNLKKGKGGEGQGACFIHLNVNSNEITKGDSSHLDSDEVKREEKSCTV